VIMDRLSLGGFSLRNARVDYPVTPVEWDHPLLGEDVLRRFRVLFDFPKHAMYLRPVRMEPKRWEFERDGGCSIPLETAGNPRCPIVRVSVNGRPTLAAVSTGNPECYIDRDLVRDAGLVPTKEWSTDGSDDEAAQIHLGLVQRSGINGNGLQALPEGRGG